MVRTILFLFFMLSFLVDQAQESYKVSHRLHKQMYSEHQLIAVNIQKSMVKLLNGGTLELEGERIFSPNVLPEFYTQRGFVPAWASYKAIEDVIKALHDSWEDGLNQEDYHGSGIRKLLKKIDNGLSEKRVDPVWVAEFDILVTDAVLLYAYHLLEGKVDPETLDPNWNYDYKGIMEDAPYQLEKAIESANVSVELQQLRPQNVTYKATRELLINYTQLKEKGGWPAVLEGETIHEGENDERIVQIKKRLARTGELYLSTDLESMVYDSLLVADVKRFQNRNGLKPDGVIGKGTIGAMNISVDERINTLRVNLERNRWIDSDLTEDYIIVNIAGFKAYYFENHKLRHSTNVMVGKERTRTPVFKDRLRYIEFNPTWTVPTSIIGNTIIPKMKKDPDYILKNNFELIDRSGKVVPQSQIDASELSLRNFAYTVRQKPGADNALGEVKFIFPNKHSVYLHDTPSKSLFEREKRAFSHGCIRTQYPLDLAEILLNDTEWTREKIDSVIQTRETVRAYPEKDIDVLIMYWTAGYYEGEGIGFFRDVYDRDAKVLEQLDKTEINSLPRIKAGN